MRVLAADRATALARARLRPGARGSVHSVFARTINLTLDKELEWERDWPLARRPDRGLDARSWGPGERGQGVEDRVWVSIHLQSPSVPLVSPFGLTCRVAFPAAAGDYPASGITSSERPLAGIPPTVVPGSPVRVDAGVVWLGDAIRVDVTRARVIDATLPVLAPMPSVHAVCRTALARVRSGLLPALAGILGIVPLPDDSLAPLAAPRLARLACATACAHADLCQQAARALLGLGPGLTPAGDDLIAGWVAGLWTSGTEGRQLVHLVGRGLLAAAAERTTPLSRAFLAAALAVAAAEPLGRTIRRPEPAMISALLRTGATSGADSLAGYLLARWARDPATLPAAARLADAPLARAVFTATSA